MVAAASAAFLMPGAASAEPPEPSKEGAPAVKAEPTVKTEPTERAAPAPKKAEAAPSPKRPVPDYDGREEPTTAGDVLLWIPRVLFFPAYLATEYVVRKPLGFVVTAAEHERWIQQITGFFVFGPDDNIGIIPTALIDFGFRPSAGVYFFYDDLGTRGNDLRVHAATGGENWFRLTVADRIAIDDRSYVKVRAEGWIRPDWLFTGIGPEALERNESYYLAKSLEGGFSFHGAFKGSSSIETYMNVKTVAFEDEACCDELSIGQRVAQGVFDLPTAFETGYTANRIGLRLGLDSRRPRPEPGSGVRLDLAAEHGVNLENVRSRWLRYGGTLSGFVDLTGHNRVLSLGVTTLFADRLGDTDMPFTELVSLGGEGPMGGFREGRMLGQSAAVATLEYRYPIWSFLDGSLQVAVGNVFGEHLRGFDPDLLRLSWTAGVRTGERDHSFDVLVGGGTETFKQGAELQEVRFLLGASRGF